MKKDNFLGTVTWPYLMAESRPANVDTKFDFLVVEVMMQHPEEVEG